MGIFKALKAVGWIAALAMLSCPAASFAAAPDGACANFYGGPAYARIRSLFSPVFGKVVLPWPTTSKPPRGGAFREPNAGTCVVRVTNHRQDAGITTFARNDYSRRQAFNADDSLQLIYSYDGSWHLYDPKTYVHLGGSRSGQFPSGIPGLAGDAEPQWDPSDPDGLYYLPTNGVGMNIHRRNIATGQVNTWDLQARLKARWPDAMAAWTKSEGSPSADGRYWCLMVDGEGWVGRGIVTWDRQTDTILGMRDVTERPDHVSMSPSGNYCVVNGSQTVAWSRDLQTSQLIVDGGEHSDIARNAAGDDIFVSVYYFHAGHGDFGLQDGEVYMHNLRTRTKTVLFSSYSSRHTTALHFSGKAYDRPGWIVVSTYSETPPDNGSYSQQWLHRKVMVVELAANPRILNVADTRVLPAPSNTQPYWSEPHASVNRGLTRIVWNSTWDGASDLDVDTYMAQLPTSALDFLPPPQTLPWRLRPNRTSVQPTTPDLPTLPARMR